MERVVAYPQTVCLVVIGCYLTVRLRAAHGAQRGGYQRQGELTG